jgi:hypothetical protein
VCIDFTSPWPGVELPERAASCEHVTVPCRIERHVGLAQPFDRHRVDAFGRRPAVHVVEMVPQQRTDLRAGQVILEDAQRFHMPALPPCNRASKHGSGAGSWPGIIT